MDNLTEKNANSIVAQRLALFRKLERSRPRSDDGSPLTFNSSGFIYNKGLGKEIVSDFQILNAQKSPVRHLAFNELLSDRSTGKTVYKSSDMASAPQNSSDDGAPAPSVRQLRSIFEASTMRLTARNSAEEERDQGAIKRQNEVPPLPKSVKPVLVSKDQCLEKRVDSTAGTKSRPIRAMSNDEKAVDEISSSLDSTPVCISQTKCEVADAKPVISEKPEKFVIRPKPLPSIPNSEGADFRSRAEDEHVNQSSNTGNESSLSPLNSFVRHGLQFGAVGSGYVDPSHKAETPIKSPTVSEKKWETVPIKQRTLGRGEIKPYEIVNIVKDEDGDDQLENHAEVEEEAQHKNGKFRMESMYVSTGGNFNVPQIKSGVRDMGGEYQEIPDQEEEEQSEKMGLERDEWDLSNLNQKESSTPEIARKQETMSPIYENVGEHGTEGGHFEHESVSSCGSSDWKGSTLSSSILSDIHEGWDSDEFDEYTDDEVLEEVKFQTKTSDADATKKKIWNIVNEILATEKAYTKRLHLLEKFQSRLLSEAKENNIVPEKVVTEIFSNLSSICTFHATMLLPDLEKRITNWSANEKIGDIFKTLGHCLKLYSDYVKNFDHATTTLNQWMKKSPKFASIIEELQKQPECEHLTLQHHMLGPIQRVPRYRLLLQDYLKKLPKDSPDRAEAEESLSVISEAANHSNNSMKGMEQFKKLVEIEERIAEGLQGESLATASRVFIKEGELVKIAARSDQRQARILLLFNDLLLCCNKIPPVGKLKVRQMMDIPGMMVQDMDEDLGEVNSFRVRSRQRVLDLAASSKEEKDEWTEAIRNVIKDYETKRGCVLKQHLEQEARKESDNSEFKVGESAPVWVKDEDVTMCMLCAVRFSLLSRRHHCRACGRIVCDNCSKFKAQLAYMNNTVKRVCYVCNKKINGDRIQESDSFVQKSKTLAQVNRDPKRRQSTLVTEVKGELTWKAPGKGWAKGYFIVSGMVLFVQKGKKDPKAQMTIPLPGYTVTRPLPADDIDESKHPHTFKLYFGSKKELTYFFRADNEETTERWMNVITYSTRAEKPPAHYKTL